MDQKRKDELKKELTSEQFQVICNEGTEPPFENAYWDNKQDGIYLDRVSGAPLFLSLHKFDSGTGWPSFTRPINPSEIIEKSDFSYGIKRTEVRTQRSDAHLGHVFSDGPKDQGGLRYCINSASLRFVPLSDFDKEGLESYKKYFPQDEKMQTVVLGGGCFWGVEDLLRKLNGVVNTEVGYAGGELNHPTYHDVKNGTTHHAEVVKIDFIPQIITLSEILDFFFTMHDPTTLNQQGNDKGSQYRSIIFYNNNEEKEIAQSAITTAEKMELWKGKKIFTELKVLQTFWPAENYHQDYLEKNPDGYTCHYIRKI